jgi:hypothetical protein
MSPEVAGAHVRERQDKLQQDTNRRQSYCTTPPPSEKDIKTKQKKKKTLFLFSFFSSFSLMFS